MEIPPCSREPHEEEPEMGTSDQVRICFCLLTVFGGFNVTAAVFLQTLCPAPAVPAPELGREQFWGGAFSLISVHLNQSFVLFPSVSRVCHPLSHCAKAQSHLYKILGIVSSSRGWRHQGLPFEPCSPLGFYRGRQTLLLRIQRLFGTLILQLDSSGNRD